MLVSCSRLLGYQVWITTTHKGMVVRQVTSRESSRLIGEDLKNCFRNEVSDIYVRAIRYGMALLFLLRDSCGTPSLLRIRFKPSGGVWSVDEHYGTANTPVGEEHSNVADDLVCVLNACITPEGFHRSAPQSPLGDLDVLRASLLPSWEQRQQSPLSTLSQPWHVRFGRWLNDDEWWGCFDIGGLAMTLGVAIVLGLLTQACHALAGNFETVNGEWLLLDVPGIFVVMLFLIVGLGDVKNKIKMELHIHRRQKRAKTENPRRVVEVSSKIKKRWWLS